MGVYVGVVGKVRLKGDDLTYPQKINESENNRLVIFPAASAASIPAITIFVKVPAKIKNVKINKNISAPLSAT